MPTAASVSSRMIRRSGDIYARHTALRGIDPKPGNVERLTFEVERDTRSGKNQGRPRFVGGLIVRIDWYREVPRRCRLPAGSPPSEQAIVSGFSKSVIGKTSCSNRPPKMRELRTALAVALGLAIEAFGDWPAWLPTTSPNRWRPRAAARAPRCVIPLGLQEYRIWGCDICAACGRVMQDAAALINICRPGSTMKSLL